MDRPPFCTTLLLILLLTACQYDAPTAEEEAPVEFRADTGAVQSTLSEQELQIARRKLQEMDFMVDSAPDKLLNFLLSEKDAYRRELYTFTHGYYPDGGAGTLSEGLKKELRQLARVLRAYPGLRIELSTHAAGSGGIGNAARQESERRAALIRSALQKEQVDSSQIQVLPLGAQEPIADQNSAQGRRINRRLELRITSL